MARNRSSRSIRVLSLCLLGSWLFMAGVCSPGRSTALSYSRDPGEVARSADSFVDSLGVVIHLHYDGAYGTPWDTVMKPKLLALGIRHVRDGAYTYAAANYNDYYYQRVRALAAAGIRFDMVTSMKTSYGDATDYTKLADVYQWSNGAIDSFEGINEPNIQGVTDWINVTRAAQQQLYQTVKSNPTLANVPVIGPSVIFDGPKQIGDISAFLDYGNSHPYPGGNCPTCGDVYGQNIDTFLPTYRLPSGNKPMIMTETGYHNAIHTTDNHHPASELAAGKYMPRLFFEYFNRGFVRSYSYEFVDLYNDATKTIPDQHFGLLRNDGSVKPAYTALKSVIGLLSDPGASFTPGTLSYTLSGNTAQVHHTLLQKRDGTFYLALWLEKPSYDTGQRPNAPDDMAARSDLTVAPLPVTLTLQQPMGSATIYSLDDGGVMTSAPASISNNQINLNVPDKVTIVQLSSQTTTTNATATSSTGTAPPVATVSPTTQAARTATHIAVQIIVSSPSAVALTSSSDTRKSQAVLRQDSQNRSRSFFSSPLVYIGLGSIVTGISILYFILFFVRRRKREDEEKRQGTKV